MKKTIYIIAMVIGVYITGGCQKISSIDTDALSSVNIVNTINGGGGIKMNLNREMVTNNTFQILAINAGNGNIKVYDATTNAVYYNQAQETVNGGLYSLYLTGTASAPEGAWVKDIIKPYGSENTTTTVRVVNLSNAGPVNVTLASAPTVNVFSNIGYKSVSAFQDFAMPLTIPAGTTTFQFRNASNTILASFTLPTSARNRSYAVVLKGLVGATGSSSIGTIGQQFY